MHHGPEKCSRVFRKRHGSDPLSGWSSEEFALRLLMPPSGESLSCGTLTWIPSSRTPHGSSFPMRQRSDEWRAHNGSLYKEERLGVPRGRSPAWAFSSGSKEHLDALGHRRWHRAHGHTSSANHGDLLRLGDNNDCYGHRPSVSPMASCRTIFTFLQLAGTER